MAKKNSSAKGLLVPPVEAQSTVMITTPHRPAPSASPSPARPRLIAHSSATAVSIASPATAAAPAGELTSGGRDDVAIRAPPITYSPAALATARLVSPPRLAPPVSPLSMLALNFILPSHRR